MFSPPPAPHKIKDIETCGWYVYIWKAPIKLDTNGENALILKVGICETWEDLADRFTKQKNKFGAEICLNRKEGKKKLSNEDELRAALREKDERVGDICALLQTGVKEKMRAQDIERTSKKFIWNLNKLIN